MQYIFRIHCDDDGWVFKVNIRKHQMKFQWSFYLKSWTSNTRMKLMFWPFWQGELKWLLPTLFAHLGAQRDEQVGFEGGYGHHFCWYCWYRWDSQADSFCILWKMPFQPPLIFQKILLIVVVSFFSHPSQHTVPNRLQHNIWLCW